MRYITILLLLIAMTTQAQSVSSQDSTLFDFWVGDWDLTWTNGEGNLEKGTNRIVRILEGKVIQENFTTENGSLKGMSISVFNSRRKTWHQAWVDNQGGYYDFEGKVEGDKRIFSTRMKEVNGMKIVQRMVFSEIKKDSLTWNWELSKDGGITWETQWKINYKRKG